MLPVPSADHVKLFHLFALFGGNAKRTAIVARCDVAHVESLAHDFQWKEKINGVERLDTEEGKEAQREINRVASFVVANNLTKVFETLIADLGADEKFAREFCTVTDEDGQKLFNTKNLVELAKGLQIVTDIKYRALGDKIAADADTSSAMKGNSSLVINIYDALQKRFDRMPVAADVTTKVVAAVQDARPAST